MERRCAWCGRELEGGASETGKPTVVTHGICPACYDRLSTGTGLPIQEFLASLGTPVLLMDSDHTVGAINEAASDALGNGREEILGERIGTVFDCENAHLPGGCSRTVHCSGCTIRQSVAHTHLTGEPRLNVPATLRVVDDAALADVDLTISTVRVGDRILLKIDRFAR